MIELAIDGSFEAIDLSIFEKGELIYGLFVRSRSTHSKILTHIFDSAFKQLSLELNQIDRFYCCIGCGKYTSLRVTLATMKGMLFDIKDHIYTFALPDLIAASSGYERTFRVICRTSKSSCCFADYTTQNGETTRISEIEKSDIEEAENTDLPIVTRPAMCITSNIHKVKHIEKVKLLDLKPLY